jgi:molecular chaperone Hsp33
MNRDHDYDGPVRETLGHAAAAAGLIAQSFKFDGAITLQIQGEGDLRMLVMQCTSELEVRGMATYDQNGDARSFGELMKNAHCAITVDTGDRPYQGIVEIEHSSLADSLENYFARSVQVPSHVMLVSNASLSGGLLLQQMPGQYPIDEDDWNRLGYVAATLSTRDFDGVEGMDLVGKLFAEDDVRVFSPKPVVFRCRCSRHRAEEVLRMLGETETNEVVEERGRVDVTCEYCGRQRSFDAIDVSRLFAENVVSGPDSVQ